MYQAIGNFYEGIMVTGTVSDTTAFPFHACCSPNFIAVCGKLIVSQRCNLDADERRDGRQS
eukprot:SAG25_NODE_2425_length_1619_cov_1.704605_1_plen_60_part_10